MTDADLSKETYQVIISRLEGERISDSRYREYIFELIGKGICGLIVFGGRMDEVRDFISELQSFSGIPLIIAADVERGVGQQLSGTTSFPSQMAMAAAIDRHNTDDVQMLRKTVNAVAWESIDAGINMPLIPVLDVNANPDNPIICTRAFSDDAETVSWLGKIYIETLQEKGLICCAKHFPGHGDTSFDSHISLPVIAKSMDALKDIDIYPFGEAVGAGIRGIMVGHLSIPVVDMMPSSLSKRLVVDVLRGELNFKGLILTDAVNMNALSHIDNIPVKCLNAGADILLHPDDPDDVAGSLSEAVKSGAVKHGTIDTAIDRISAYRRSLKNIRPASVDYSGHAELARSVRGKSVTLIKGGSGFVPLRDRNHVSIVIARDGGEYDTSPLAGFLKNGSDILSVEEGSTDRERLNRTAVIAVFTSVSAWKGSAGLDERTVRTIQEVINRSTESIVISFGNPYVLREFGKAHVLIAAYDGEKETQCAVMDRLTGRRDFEGRLPVGF